MPAKLLAFRKTKWFPHWKLQEKVVFSSEHPTLQRLVDAFGVVRGGWPSPPPSDGLLTIDEPGASSDWRLHRKNELQILSGNAGCAASSDPYPLTVYVHVRHGSTLEAIEYWFFYYYDAWNLWSLHQTHEGDWEHITVFLRRKAHNGPEAALPVGVQYAWHKDSSTIAWPETERCSDPCTLPTSPAPAPPSQEHPLVFVGLGSHASYPFQDTWFPSTIAMGERIEGADVATGDTVSPAARLVALGTNDRSFLPNLPISGEKRGRPGGAQLMWGERGSRVPYWSEIHGSGPLSPQQQGDNFSDPSEGTGKAQPLVSLFGGSGICTTSGRAIDAWWGSPTSMPNESLYRLGVFGSSEVLTSGADGRDHYLTSYDTNTVPNMTNDTADKHLACATPRGARTVRLTQLLLSLHAKPADLAARNAWAWQVHFPSRAEEAGAPPATAVAPVTLLYCYDGKWWRAVFKGVPRNAQDAVLQGTPAQPSLGIDQNGDGVVEAGHVQSPVSRDQVRRVSFLTHSC